MTDIKWGGPWTELKLEVLQSYLRFYTIALKNQSFSRIYIDAFAGSGQCDIRDGSGGTKTIEGSAKIALDNNPPFTKLFFIESDVTRHSQLAELCEQYSKDLPIEIFNSDANEMIKEICENTDWKRNRAVLFLDPYGQEVEWSTVEKISKTKAIDLWYFFPLSGFYRNMPINQRQQDEAKKSSLNKLLGTNEWEDFYTEEEFFTADMFDLDKAEPGMTRESGWEDLKEFVSMRLRNIFEAVSEPLLLPRVGPPQFALFFAVSNKAAIGPGMKAAKWILERA